MKKWLIWMDDFREIFIPGPSPTQLPITDWGPGLSPKNDYKTDSGNFHLYPLLLRLKGCYTEHN